MKRYSNVLLLIVAMLVMAGSGSAFAQAGPSAPNITYNPICDTSDSLCLNLKGNNDSIGTAIVAYRQQNVENEGLIQNDDTSRCGGAVTSTCPFTKGSGFNSRYKNDPIVNLKWQAYDNCIGTNGTSRFTNVINAACNGTGTDWVLHVSSPGSPEAIISVAGTNTNYANGGGILFLTSGGSSGNSATIETSSSSGQQWEQK